MRAGAQRHLTSTLLAGARQDALVGRAAMVGLGWVSGYAVVNRLSPRFDAGAAAVFHLVSTAPIVAAVLAVVGAAWTRGRRGGVELAWLFFALSGVLSLLGGVVRGIGGNPSDGYGASTWLGESLIGFACLAAIPGFVLAFARVRPFELRRTVLDVGLVGVGLGALAWYGLIATALAHAGSDATRWGTVYPISGVVVLIVLLALGFGRFRRLPLSVRVIAYAYLVAGVTGCAQVTQGLDAGPTRDGSWLNVGYQLAALLFLLGGLRAVRLRHSAWPPTTVESPGGPMMADVPLLVSGAGAGLMAAGAYLHNGGSWPPLVLVALVMVGLVGRQQLRIRDQDRLAHRLAEALAEQQELAVTDGLTGLRNRRFFEDALTTELIRGRRHGRTVSLVLLDIDHFKAINDTYGHTTGDDALRALADRLRSLIRGGDIMARYGGEEFVWLLPDTDETGATTMAERLRTALQDQAIPLPHGETLRMTASLGVASGSGQLAAADLLRSADEALYRAKAGGRNQVCRASEAEPPSRPADPGPAPRALCLTGVGAASD